MSKLILIIEDSKTLAMYEKDVLTKAGHQVVVAHTLQEAQNLIDKHKRDIILSVVDINLPDNADLALPYLLKYNIPVIAMTGSFHPALRDKVVDTNIIDYIVLEDDQQLELLQSTINRVINNHKRRILIVDDSNASRFALKSLLLSQNFTIHEASSAAEALLILKEHNDIEIALIDYEMPKMNGAELSRIIRKSFSRMELAILAISIHTKPMITIEFLKAGANDFITKPYVKEEVLARIAVNIDLIDQHNALKKEILERTEIEKELKRSQSHAESANIAKSNFLANMSHEIRTPMNAIIGFVDVLCKNEKDKEKLEKLEIVKRAGASLTYIIDDILDFSKIENGKITIEKLLFNTEEPFVLMVQLFQDKADEKNISISLEIDKELPPKAYGDTTRVKQIISNLLSNAIKFSSENSKIEVTIKPFEEFGLLCQVKDYGMGIAAENQDNIFKMFEQEDVSTTREFGGTGLGLSISKSLAHIMNGDIYVDSLPHEGSTFSFHIELFKDLDKHTVETKGEVTQADTSSPIEGKILLAEDNKANQLLMKILLQELGLSLDIVNDGLEAVKAYQTNTYDLILMDENMPNLNGISATHQIRQIEEVSQSKSIPIIAVTANALKEDKARFLKAGMDDYVSKPIDAHKLEIALRKFLL